MSRSRSRCTAMLPTQRASSKNGMSHGRALAGAVWCVVVHANALPCVIAAWFPYARELAGSITLLMLDLVGGMAFLIKLRCAFAVLWPKEKTQGRNKEKGGAIKEGRVAPSTRQQTLRAGAAAKM